MISLFLVASLALAFDETVVVIGNESEELTKPNSSHYISKEKLNKQQDIDITRTVKSVPGVYVREEEGYGLRPNIGLRGVNPDRSKKVNFMEDGILSGPAPYSAPAAYFTPSMMHTEGLEVFKGVATVIYGPNSVGGSINFLTPEPLDGRNAFLDGALGSYDYRKIVGRASYGGEVYSVLFQGGYHETTGYKELPSGNDTGFQQSDFLLKSRIRLKDGDNPHYLNLKVSHTAEESDETYLGLTDEDFHRSAYRRYAASELDHMKWHHETYQASYTMTLGADSTLAVTGYWNAFDRVWYRFDRFNNGTSVRDVLSDPATYQDLYQILEGTQDSAVLPAGAGNLGLARNKRTFSSRGAQLQHLLTRGKHDIHWGLRVHEDQIRRNHGLDYYAMTGGQMIRTADARLATEVDRDTSWSQAVFFKDEIALERWRFTLAARYERVETEAREFITNGVYGDDKFANSDEFFVPGAGVLYTLTPSSSVFFGVNKGYAPVGPGQKDSVKPEESTNFELGYRYMKGFFFEAIGFYSDYQNIKGICSFSAGCSAAFESEEFNGGEASIFGAESRLRFDLHAAKFKFPFELNYTYTQATFDNSFTTQSPEWGVGTIKSGSPLPYVPEHQFSMSLGAERGPVSSDLRVNWTGRQWDQAAETNRKEVHAYGVVDWNTKYYFSRESFAYLKIDNVLNNEYIVSYRPYGARPGKAQTFLVGFKHTF